MWAGSLPFDYRELIPALGRGPVLANSDCERRLLTEGPTHDWASSRLTAAARCVSSGMRRPSALSSPSRARPRWPGQFPVAHRPSVAQHATSVTRHPSQYPSRHVSHAPSESVPLACPGWLTGRQFQAERAIRVSTRRLPLVPRPDRAKWSVAGRLEGYDSDNMSEFGRPLTRSCQGAGLVRLPESGPRHVAISA